MHLGIIPDGNRRYAEEYGCSKEEAYREGAETMESLLKYSLDQGIDCLSIYTLSNDNYEKRSQKELSLLFDLYEQYFDKLLHSDELDEHDVQVIFLGEWTDIEHQKVYDTITQLVDRTRGNDGKKVAILFNYLTDFDIPQYKEEANKLPLVDFLVRTSGVQRTSGFLPTRTQYAEHYYEAKNFPACDREDFEIWINYYESRQRRFGE